MEKVAIIEMCETGVKLVIMKVAEGGYFNVCEKLFEVIKLGDSVKQEGVIPVVKANDTIDALKLFRNICTKSGVSKMIAFAKSFVNDAKNHISFFDEIYNNTGLNFEILTKEIETKSIYLGVINCVDVPKGVILDVGENETCIIQYNRRTMINSAILPFGSVSFANEEKKYPQIIEEVSKKLDELTFLNTFDEETLFVGTGSIMLSVGKLARKVSHYPLDIDNNYVVNRNVFDAVFDTVKDLDLDKTKKLKGISDERADSLVAGMAIVKAILDKIGIKQFSICTGDMEQGLIYGRVVPETNEKPLSDMLNHSLEEIRMFYGEPESNSLNVYNLAVILFKQLKVIHKLPRAYIKPLRIAASMYDCGKRINFSNFANYSLEIIINSNIIGVSHKDLLLAGFVCKYQNLDNINLSEWVKYKDILTEADLDAVRKLGVIVHLAGMLDKSKGGNIVDVNCDILGDSIIMKTVTNGNASFDIRQGMKVAGDFKKVLKKTLQII